jgi:predicted TIM-barrel fold metal-dependent hydrolase
MNRRNFMSQMAIASTAVLTPKWALAQAHPRVIDIHAHCVFPGVAEIIKDTPLKDTGFADWQTLSPARMELMDGRAIDMQVLSVNRYWWNSLEPEIADKVVRYHDEQLAVWCNQYPDRFTALSSVSLEYPELATAQLEYAVNELGLRGASVGGHTNGEAVSGARFDPFWAKAAELNVPVFMHPNNSDQWVDPEIFSGAGSLPNIIGNPLETAIFLSKLIYEGVFDRFPGLKVVGSHGGGYLPSYLSRFEVACELRPDAACINTKSPSEYLKSQIFVDSMVFSDEGLRHLVAEMGSGQIVFGSDVPFSWPDTVPIIEASDALNADQKEAVLGGNLARLLKL